MKAPAKELLRGRQARRRPSARREQGDPRTRSWGRGTLRQLPDRDRSRIPALCWISVLDGWSSNANPGRIGRQLPDRMDRMNRMNGY